MDGGQKKNSMKSLTKKNFAKLWSHKIIYEWSITFAPSIYARCNFCMKLKIFFSLEKKKQAYLKSYKKEIDFDAKFYGGFWSQKLYL